MWTAFGIFLGTAINLAVFYTGPINVSAKLESPDPTLDCLGSQTAPEAFETVISNIPRRQH